MNEEPVDPATLERAGVIAADLLGVRSGERVLVMWSEPQKAVADAICTGVTERGGGLERILLTSEEGYAEPGVEAAAAMLAADVVFGVTTGSLSHTEARRAATATGTRTATLGGITTSIFARMLNVDYGLLKRDGEGLASLLTDAENARITSEVGTDLTLSVANRTAFAEDGDLSTPGAFGNLPAGEATIAPLETQANGVVVIDGCLDGHGVLEEPVELRIVDGRLEAASGPVGAAFLLALDAGGPDGRLIAELGIGTNPAARIVDNILEAEKVRGTVHIAFGASAAIGGLTSVSVHMDCVILRPTLQIGDLTVMESGRLVTELWSSE
jgi:leucyl aminopeptidase (aminopeptidase T)